jgi:hypothetical protein
MSYPISADEFARALHSESGLLDIASAEGFVRKAPEETVLEFSPAATHCLRWIKIPLQMIDKVQLLGKRLCLGQLQEYAVLYFKRPENRESMIYAELLQYSAAECTSCAGATHEPSSSVGDWGLLTTPAGLGPTEASLNEGAAQTEGSLASAPAASRFTYRLNVRAQGRLPGWSYSENFYNVNTVNWSGNCRLGAVKNGSIITIYCWAPPGTPNGAWFSCSSLLTFN